MDTEHRGILQLFMSIPILFGNGIIIFVLMKYIYIRTHCDILILNLTSADLFVGLVLLLQSISCLNIEFNILSDVCIFRFSSMVLVSFASLFAVLLTALERYVCIYLYNSNPGITVRKTVVAICVSWLYCVLLTLCPVAAGTYSVIGNGTGCLPSRGYMTFIPVQYFLILLTMCTMYIKMCRMATSKKRQIMSEPNLVLNSRMMKFQHELRATKFMALLLVIFMFCWTPFAITLIIQSATEDVNKIAVQIADITAFLGVLNSMVNPVVYPLQNRRFRKAFQQMFEDIKRTFKR